MPVLPDREPILTLPYDLALCGCLGAIAGIGVSVVSEPLAETHQTAERHALNAQLDSTRAAYSTEQDELRLLQQQGLDKSEFAAFLRGQIHTNEQHITTLQADVRPFESAHADFILGSTALGFLAAVGLRAGRIAWTRHHQRRQRPA